MKFKKILAGAMAGAMVLASVTGVSAATAVTDDVTIDGGFSASTGTVTLSGDFDITYTFHNVSNGTDNWDNYIVEMNNEDGLYLDVRSDNYGWFGGITADESDTLTFGDGSADWDTWAAAMQAGQDVTVNVVRIAGSVVVTTTAADETFTATAVVSEYADGCDLTLRITGEECTITNVAFTDNTGISISDMKVLAGGSSTFDVTYTPSSSIGSDLTYVSDNANVTVEGNTVTVSEDAEDGETANITATYGDYTTTFLVTVTNTENPITTVTPSVTSVEVEVGSTATVTATYAPEDTTDSTSATWVSADESIAIVEGGVITGVAVGETTVTVTIGSVSAEIAVSVTEAASEEASESTDSDSSDTSDDSSTEETETETEETVTTVEESETMTIESFWTSFTSGYEVTEDGLTLTLTTTNNGSSNWENVIWVLYSSDSGYLCTSGADSDDAAADNYVEYYVGRADAYGWDGASAVGTATLEATYSDDFAWETWLAATQAGAEVTITATLDGDGNAVVTLECADMSYTVTVPVNADSTIYLALTGENCTLSDLTVNGESANFPILVQTAVTTDDTETTDTETETTSTSDGTGSTTTTTTTTTTTSTSTGGANTGDASPIIPIAVAVLGCAVVVVASKKRMA